MADLAAGNVTVTISRTTSDASAMLNVWGTIAFGNGVLTYPNAAGGVPIAISKFGFAKQLNSITFTEETGGSGLEPRYDISTSKLRLFEVGSAVASGTNAASTVSPYYENDYNSCTAPTIALTHNADPATNLSAAPLYGVEGYGASQTNIITLQSTTAANADVLGETANGVGGGVAASARFFVKDSDSPAGVQIYVNESSSDQLEFVSPTATDGYIIMPFETAAGGIPGFAVRVLVHHNASAADGKALYFDDNGSADAQLAFVDTGAAGGEIPSADVGVLGGFYGYQVSGNMGVAAAQVFTGSSIAEQAQQELDASDAPAAQTWQFHAKGF